MSKKSDTDGGLSKDTKTILVVLLLIFLYPIGVIMMFLWMKWPVWLKFLILTPFLLIALAIISGISEGVLLNRMSSARRVDLIRLNNAANSFCVKNNRCPNDFNELLSVDNVTLNNSGAVFTGEYTYQLTEKGKACLIKTNADNSMSYDCKLQFKE